MESVVSELLDITGMKGAQESDARNMSHLDLPPLLFAGMTFFWL